MGLDLPEVRQRFVADISGYLDKLHVMAKGLEDLNQNLGGGMSQLESQIVEAQTRFGQAMDTMVQKAGKSAQQIKAELRNMLVLDGRTTQGVVGSHIQEQAEQSADQMRARYLSGLNRNIQTRAANQGTTPELSSSLASMNTAFASVDKALGEATKNMTDRLTQFRTALYGTPEQQGELPFRRMWREATEQQKTRQSVYGDREEQEQMVGRRLWREAIGNRDLRESIYGSQQDRDETPGRRLWRAGLARKETEDNIAVAQQMRNERLADIRASMYKSPQERYESQATQAIRARMQQQTGGGIAELMGRDPETGDLLKDKKPKITSMQRFATGLGAFFEFRAGMEQMIEAWSQYVQTYIKTMADAGAGILSGVGKATSAFITGFFEAANAFSEGATISVKSLMSGDIIGGNIKALSVAIGGALKGLTTSITGAFLGLAGGVTALVSASYQMAAAGIKAISQGAGGAIQAVSAVAAVGSALLPGAGLVMPTAIALGGNLLGSSVSGIGGAMAGMTGAMGEAISKMMSTAGPLIGEMFDKLSKSAIEFGQQTLGAFAEITSTISKAGREMEKMQTIFAALTRGSGKSGMLFDSMIGMSQNSPYSLRGLNETSEQLLSMGISTNNLLPALKALGDISLGSGDKMHRLAQIFGEVEEGGRLTQFRFRELAKLGVTTADFGKAMGISPADVQQRLGTVGIGRGDLAKTLNMLTGPGGRFGDFSKGFMESTAGQFQRLENVVEVSLGKIGMAFNKGFNVKEAFSSLSDWVNTITPKLEHLAEVVGGALRNAFQELKVVISGIGASFGDIFTIDKLEEFSKSMVGMADKILEAFELVGQQVLATFSKISKFAGDMLVKLSAMLFKMSVSPTLEKNEAHMIWEAASLVGGLGGDLRRAADVRGLQQQLGLGVAGLRERTQNVQILQQAGGLPGMNFAPNVPAAQPDWTKIAFGVGGGLMGKFFGGLDTHGFDLSPLGRSVMEDLKKKAEGEKSSSGRLRGALEILDKHDHPGLAGFFAKRIPGLGALVPGMQPPSNAEAGMAKKEMFDVVMQRRKELGLDDMASRLPSYATMGSQEARDIINKAQVQAGDNDPMTMLLQTAQAAMDQREQMMKDIREMADAMKNLPPDLADKIAGQLDFEKLGID